MPCKDRAAPPERRSFVLARALWDLWCLVSIVGIWPRWIEPSLLRITRIRHRMPHLPTPLQGLRIVQFSDLHLNPRVSNARLERLRKTITNLDPDILVFTGDFLCHSRLNDAHRLERFLNSVQGRHGTYASLGNHDYAAYAGYDGPKDPKQPRPPAIISGLQLLFGPTPKLPNPDSRPTVPLHRELVELLARTPFQLLNNETRVLEVQGSKLQLAGVGDLWAGQCHFSDWDPTLPGLILCHNPDGIVRLSKAEHALILSGHTHGGQVNLPGMWHKFCLLDNPKLKRGRVEIGNQTIYVNRGVGAVMPFRWFSTPEILEVTLE